jgi:DmsE family decaheme c-type cytochrome
VGSTCHACHEDIFKAHQKSPHFAVESNKRRGFEGKSCESCHGPGSKHAESVSPADIQNPAKLAPAETDRTCLQCHLNQPTHAVRIQISHAKNQLSCVSCHPIHQKVPSGLGVRKAAEVNAQCARCHVSASSQFQRPFRHRVPEGIMSCRWVGLSARPGPRLERVSFIPAALAMQEVSVHPRIRTTDLLLRGKRDTRILFVFDGFDR